MKEEISMRNVSITISILVLLCGCGVKSILRKTPQVKSEIIRKADWDVEFRDVFFLNAKQGWVIGEKGTILIHRIVGKLGLCKRVAQKSG